MTHFELKDIKDIRKKVGLTQHQLAKQAGVSQSLVAKIESGRIDPTFTKAKKLFETLDSLAKEEEMIAEQVMKKKIISVVPSSSIKVAVKKMKFYNISQMPVIKDNKSIGMISEAILLDALLNNEGKSIKDVMGDSPPVVSGKAMLSVVSNLLRFFPLVLVSKKGRLVGVITKSDVLQNV